MIQIGEYNTLTIDRATSVGLFLTTEDGSNDVLLPRKYVPKKYNIGDTITVFCYLDHQERLIAATLKPRIRRNNFAFLKVVTVSEVGAFLDWGLEKHLLVPFREQLVRMVEGKYYLVYCYLDEKTQRLVASSRINKFLSNKDIKIAVFDQVALIISRITPMGIEVIINQKYKGLVYYNEIFQDYKLGEERIGFVKKIRKDGKIDISLQESGYRNVETVARKIRHFMEQNKGYLPLKDRSTPEEIKQLLKMSKKSFKKGIGLLYKSKLINLEEDGIYLK